MTEFNRAAHVLRNAVGAASLLVAVVATCGCSSSPDDASGAAPSSLPQAPDKTTWDATFKSEATVLDASFVASTLKNADSADGVYRFDASARDELSTLEPGRAVLISGVDVVQVVSVDTDPSSGEIIVTTTPASLPDVVQEGHASWDIGMQFAGAGSAPASFTKGGLRLQAVPRSATKLSYNGPVGMFDVQGNFTPSPDNLHFNGLVTFKSGTANLKVALDGTLKNFRTEGDVKIREGKVVAFYYKVSDLDVSLDVNLGAIALGKGSEAFTIPLEVPFPIAIGPVPAFFSVGVKLEVTPALAETSSSLGKAHFVMKGSAGVSWSADTGFSTLGSLGQSSVDYKEYDGFSTVTCGLGIVAQFPIKFGIGLNVAGAAVYATPKAEVVTNMTVKYGAAGNFPVITGNCFTADLNVGAYVGGEIRLAGLKVAKEIPIWTKVTPLVKTGKACK